MISFEEQGLRFNYRAAAIVLHDGCVLVHRVEHEQFWALPGGRVEVCEPGATTVRREMLEELGVEVEVERLVWVAETFFEDQRGRPAHELGLYFLVTLPPDSPLRERREPFFGDEGGLRLVFAWAPLDQLETLVLPLYPTFLRQGLCALPTSVTHLVHTDPQIEPGAEID